MAGLASTVILLTALVLCSGTPFLLQAGIRIRAYIRARREN